MEWVCREMAREDSLPAGWAAYLDEGTNRRFYNHKSTGESVWEHPLVGFYMGVVLMHRGGQQEMEKNDSESPPTAEEASAMEEYFEVKADEPNHVREICRMAVNAPLPPGWQEMQDADGDAQFKNPATGEMQADHPLDPYFRELLQRRRAGVTDPAPPEKATPSKSDLEAQIQKLRGDQQKSVKEMVRRELKVHTSLGFDDATSDSDVGSPLHSAGSDDHLEEGFEDSDRSFENFKTPAWRPGRVEAGAPTPGSEPKRAAWELDSAGPYRHSNHSGVAVGGGRGGEAHSSPSVRQTTGGYALDTPRRAPKSIMKHAGVSSRGATSKRGRSSQGMRQNEKVMVCIRARPPERYAKKKPAWIVDSDNGAVLLRSQAALKRSMRFYGEVSSRDRGRKVLPKFVFDEVFDERHDTKTVYTSCVKSVVMSALEGINGTIFAYGQTGSGKTHTIIGSKESPGMMLMAVKDIFKGMMAGSKSRDYLLRVGMVELYNEELRDLFASPQQRLHAGERLHIKEDAVLGVKLTGMQEQIVSDLVQVRNLILKGTKNRSTGSTKMNAKSSRSHIIFRMIIQSKATGKSKKAGVKVSVLNLVDLAGSERLRKSGSVGVRAQESSNINLSLLQLGTVISKLAEGKQGEFVPYRNSKLTRLLQPSLGGNSRTVIIGTIAVSEAHAEETSHTLRFAARAKKIVNYVQVNEVAGDNALIERYRREIQELHQQLHEQQAARAAEAQRMSPNMEAKMQQLESQNAQLLEKIELMRSKGASESPPPSPPSISMPLNSPGAKARATGGSLTKLTPEKAMQAFARACGVGLSGGGGRHNVSADAILSSIRQMRSERDLLRKAQKRKEKVAEEIKLRLANEEDLNKEHRSIEESCRALEELSGGRGQGETLAERLREAADSAVITYAELGAIERQYRELSLMMDKNSSASGALEKSSAEKRAKEEEIAILKGEKVRLTEDLANARQKRDEYALALGEDPKQLARADAVTAVAGGAAMKYAATLEKHLQEEKSVRTTLEEELRSLRKSLGAVAAKAGNSAPDQLGSAAVTMAKEARAEADRLKDRLKELEAENSRLRKNEADAPPLIRVTRPKERSQDTGSDSEGDKDEMARLKSTVYNLSKEISIVKRERDALKKGLALPNDSNPQPIVQINATGSHTPEPAGGKSFLNMQSPNGLRNSPQAHSKKFKYSVHANSGASQPSGFDTRPSPAMSKNDWKRHDRMMSLKYNHSGRREQIMPHTKWGSKSANAAEEEIQNLRRRLVEAERSRQETVQMAAVQTRTAQLSQQSNARTAQEAQALAEQLQDAMAQIQDLQKRVPAQ